MTKARSSSAKKHLDIAWQ